MEQPRVVWRKPLWQRITIGIVAVGLDVGMVALIATGSAGAWQPWFFLVVFTIGLAGWWLPKTVLDDAAVTSRGALGLTRRVPLSEVTAVGYGPLGVWIEGARVGEPAMILHAVQGIRSLGGVATIQPGGPSGLAVVTMIRERAAAAGAALDDSTDEPRTPPHAGSLWSRLR